MSETRKCGCGCGAELASNASAQQLYLTGHRQRAYQRRRNVRVREALALAEGHADVNTTPTQAVSDHSRQSRKPRRTRYALVTTIDPLTFTVLGEVSASSKRTAERDLRIASDPDTYLLAASHLPRLAV